ncbi:unnamed protein product [Rhizophagus irregularis]|nr:unnamed protein product [Rhizophagus irregularis]
MSLSFNGINNFMITLLNFYGIAKFDPENQNSQSNNYLLVMEYANSACAVSCLHNEGIIHRDLHSGEQYDIDLALEILQGLREEPVPDPPEDYVEIYTRCWNGEPDKRPTINQVVER